jgi:polyisoprenyl-teichoic acid--peptidoglycan teichoic acid transferase
VTQRTAASAGRTAGGASRRATHGRRRADGRAPVAAFLSFLFPGLGQAYNGQRLLASLLAIPALLLVIGSVAVISISGPTILARLLDARILVALIVLDVALLGWRVIAIIQAHGLRERFALRWTTLITGLLVIAALAMHGLPGWYAVKAIDTLASIAREGAGHGTEADPATTPLPEPSDQPEVLSGERVNVLLVGVDVAPGRSTFLTDTMLVVSIDSDTGDAAMLSIPRDLYGVPLPDGRVYDAKLNSLLVYASNRPDEFPSGGVGTLKRTIGELLGVTIHYYAQIDLLGFRDAIDAMGGVDVTVDRGIYDPSYADAVTGDRGFYLDPGTYHMDGTLALAYARSRMGAGDSDFTRAERQQRLLTAIGEEMTAGNLLLGLPGLLDAVKSSLSTDVPSSRIPILAEALRDADLHDIERVVLTPPEYMSIDESSVAGYILVPDIDAIRDLAADLLRDEDRAATSSPGGL